MLPIVAFTFSAIFADPAITGWQVCNHWVAGLLLEVWLRQKLDLGYC